MHNFEYRASRSLEEVIGLLAEQGAATRLLAGGTDLIVKMRAGQASPDHVIDTKQIPELNRICLDEQGLTLGAAVSCRRIYEEQPVATAYPALVDCTTLIGGIQIQGRATVGGNLCNAAPSADTIPALIVLGAVAQIRGADGERRVAVEDFCTAPGKSVLKQEELLVSIKLPALQKHSGARFLRFIPRNEMDIAIANAAASVVLNDSGDQFISARIAIGAVAPTPLLVKEAGDFLAGQPVSDAVIHRAAMIARDAARPINDMRGTTEQRRHLVEVLTARALRGAVERAREA
ncbi:MAG: FAD binding domain-containing protein [Gammaproteobacteria bacterium]